MADKILEKFIVEGLKNSKKRLIAQKHNLVQLYNYVDGIQSKRELKRLILLEANRKNAEIAELDNYIKEKENDVIFNNITSDNNGNNNSNIITDDPMLTKVAQAAKILNK